VREGCAGVALAIHSLSAERTDRTYDGGSRLKTWDKCSGNRENPIGDWKSFVDRRKNLLGDPALLVRCGAGKREGGVHIQRVVII
jgi:hypothetical protein